MKVPPEPSVDETNRAPNVATAELYPAEPSNIDFDSSDSPIYLQLITIFRRHIVFGTWPVNTRIPTIDMLAAQFGVANGTVRQALAFLEREGLIKRMRRRGTMVVRQPYQPQPIVLSQTCEGIAELVEALTFRITDERQEIEGGRHFRIVQRTYLRESEPVILEHERTDLSHLGTVEPGIWELARFRALGLSIRQSTTIGTADTATAKHLNIPVNAPVVLVQHIVRDLGGDIVFECDWLIRGDLLSIVEHYAGPAAERTGQ